MQITKTTNSAYFASQTAQPQATQPPIQFGVHKMTGLETAKEFYDSPFKTKVFISGVILILALATGINKINHLIHPKKPAEKTSEKA